ncbi:MAG: 4Fe-4S cluster-binding domain-containing protein, partial [Bacteroidales bacterium]|nr:4Fe-4S cluster-binding domain-containing protein [Bacteroidales bacterium]
MMNKTCNFCFHECSLHEGQIGLCGVRIFDGKEIRNTDNQKILASHLDPIEMKPLYHFFPNTATYSIGMLGCNIECQYCQNYHITQRPYIDNYGSFQEIDIPHLIRTMKENNSVSMSYTYSEPIVWQAVMISIAKEVKKEGMCNILVTNGTF